MSASFTFFLASVWGCIVCVSLIGWGSVVCQILRPGPLHSWGLSGAVGFCFSVIVGGVLGVLHFILPWVVILFLLLGLPFLLLHRGERFALHLPSRPSSIALLIALLAAISLRYFAAVHTNKEDFQYLDDTPAYLVFPVKMLQTGQFAPDPFCDRRMAGLGGQPWSQSFILSLFDPTSINLLDHGVVLLLLLNLVYTWLTSIGISRRFSALVLLVLLLVYPDYLNCCNFLTISLLILSLFVVLQDQKMSFREMILLALLVCGLCSLKATVIPFAGSILGLIFVVSAFKSRSIRPLVFAVAVASSAFIFLFPWMLSMRQSSGTLLCPYFGKGNSLLPSLVGTMPRKTGVICMAFGTAVSGLLIEACVRRHPAHRAWGRTAALFALGAAPVILIVAVQTGGASWIRYSQPILYGLVPLPLAALCVWSQSDQHRKYLGRIAAVIYSLALIVGSTGWIKELGPITAIHHEINSIQGGLVWNSLVYPHLVDQAYSLQQTVPAGTPILARLDYPHLLNFKRNSIYLYDHPGLAGPPPRMSERPDPQAVRAYLLSNGVRYVAYSYGDEACFPAAKLENMFFPHEWDRLAVRYALGMQAAFTRLAQSQRVIYDDGTNEVIDLFLPAIR